MVDKAGKNMSAIYIYIYFMITNVHGKCLFQVKRAHLIVHDINQITGNTGSKTQAIPLFSSRKGK